MAITNGYCTLDQAKAALGIETAEAVDDLVIEAAVTTASRQLDRHTNRKFWIDSTAVARKFWPSESGRVWINDLGSTDNLVVKVDTSGDGTYPTTLTIDVDFIVAPVNASTDGEPWESLRLINSVVWPSGSHVPPVQVSGKWGWPSVPAQITLACILQAKTLFKAPDADFGAFQIGVDGFTRVIPRLDPVARAQADMFIRRTPIDDEPRDG